MIEYTKTNKRYHTLDYYLKTKYGKKVYKVSLNASFTCPNRDGTKGTGGCIFCSSNGSGDYAGNVKDDLLTQFNSINSIMEKKWKDAYKIVYFQAYSNTYGPISKLKECFELFIDKEDVIGISIATRADCINNEVVEYIKTLKKHYKEVWVELGLQSAVLKTEILCNLKYTYDDVNEACRLLNDANIDVVVHIIDGLPYENKQDMLETIKKVNKLHPQGLKIHALNIIDNTKLATMYKQEKFNLLTEEEFVDIAVEQLLMLDKNIIIHRIGADSNTKDLIAPDWVHKKVSVVDKIDMKLEKLGMNQGDYYE